MLNCVDGFLVLPINKQHFALDGDSPDMDSGNQISFSSLISFHMISFHMILTWSIRYHSVRWYHFMQSPLRGRISHLTQSLSGHFIRTARICHWKVSPCLAHQHPPWCHQYHSIPPPVSPSPPSSPRIPRFWASSWSEAARVTLSATTWPPPPPQCGTMWDTMWHNLATTTTTTSSLGLLSDPTVTPSVNSRRHDLTCECEVVGRDQGNYVNSY